MTLNDWYYSDAGEPNGPHSAEDIRSLLLVGQIDKSTLVWKEGMQQWSAISYQSEFSGPSASATPPPLPPVTVSLTQPAPQFQARPEPAAPPLIEGERDDCFIVEPPPLEPVYAGTTGLAGPWTRYFARIFDLSLLGTALMTSITIALPYLSPAASLRWYMVDARTLFLLLLPVIMFINAGIISIFGNSVGKTIFGIKAIPVKNNSKVTYWDHLRRELTVWVRALFLGIPILSLITMGLAYRKVRKGLPTDYDLGRTTVRSYSNSVVRRIIGMLLTLTFLGGVYALNAAEASDQRRLRTASTWSNPITQVSATIPAGWLHEIVEGPEGNRLDAFTNVNTGVIALFGIETGDFSLKEYQQGLKTALAATSPLGAWTPAGSGSTTALSKASGQTIENKWPTTIYVTQAGNSFWRVVYMDTTKTTPQEVSVPELTNALLGTVR